MIEIDAGEVGRRIARYRRIADMSAEKLAAKAGAGLTRPVLANIESGRRQDVGLTQLLAIAWALGINPGDLIFPSGDPGAQVKVDGAEVPVDLVLEWFSGASPSQNRTAATTLVERTREAVAVFGAARARLDELIDALPTLGSEGADDPDLRRRRGVEIEEQVRTVNYIQATLADLRAAGD